MNQRRKGRLKLERWRRNEPHCGLDLASGPDWTSVTIFRHHGISPFQSAFEAFAHFQAAAISMAEAFVTLARAAASVFQPLTAGLLVMGDPLEPITPMTLAELYALAGGEGCSLTPARITAEGGFTLN